MTTDATLSRTSSRDGTEVGYFTSGDGPPLLLVHGGIGDHTRWDAIRPYLAEHLTVHAMDRRGRGASGDHEEYAIEREFEDVAAVVDAISETAGSPVDVYGHSFGGLCAFGAAGLTSNIGRLVLYEGWPPVTPDMWAPEPGLMDRLEKLLAAGDRDALLETFSREAVKMTDEEIAAYKAQPSWAARVAAAHTILREEPAFADTRLDPDQAARITVPTLLLVGESQTMDWQVETVAQALPQAHVVVLQGQAHTADVTAPKLVSAAILSFLRQPH